jgi:cysteine desulfurase
MSEDNLLYLDYAASTPLRPVALKMLEISSREDFANPSSAHRFGRSIQQRIETCREKFLELLGAGKGDRLIFTGSATECNNTVIKGTGLNTGDTVIYSYADHPSIIVPMERLQKQGVLGKEQLLQEDGIPDESVFLQFPEKTRLVMLTYVNNHSGAISDIHSLSRKIKTINPNIHIHVDAAQGFGKLPLSLKEGHIDSLCISGHKIGGPKGIACLYLRNGVRLSPLLDGGGQEEGLRSSTQAAPLIFSFCEAAVDAMKTIDSSLVHVTALNRLAQKCLKEKIPVLRFPFIKNSSPYIMIILLPGISSDIILRHLEQQGILISSTSACSSKIKGTNPVFSALHLPEKDHKFVLRVSFSYDNTEADVMRFCDTLASIYDDLKMFSKS